MAYNYGYYPYQQYQQQYPYQQYSNVIHVQNQSQGVFGKVVDSFDTISANDVPMSGEPTTFVKRDLSEVQVRMWSPNGQIMTTSFKPSESKNDVQMTNVSTNEIKSLYETLDSLQTGLNARLDKIEEYFSKQNAKRGAKSDE